MLKYFSADCVSAFRPEFTLQRVFGLSSGLSGKILNPWRPSASITLREKGCVTGLPKSDPQAVIIPLDYFPVTYITHSVSHVIHYNSILKSVSNAYNMIQKRKLRFRNVYIYLCVIFEDSQMHGPIHTNTKQSDHM